MKKKTAHSAITERRKLCLDYLEYTLRTLAFRDGKRGLTLKEIDSAAEVWNAAVIAERRRIAMELDRITKNQKPVKVLGGAEVDRLIAFVDLAGDIHTGDKVETKASIRQHRQKALEKTLEGMREADPPETA